MKLDLARGAAILLGARQNVEILDGKGLDLRVQWGTVWLTQQGDFRDIVLEAGDVFRLDRNGVALVQALKESHCLLRPAPRHAAARDRIRAATLGRNAQGTLEIPDWFEAGRIASRTRARVMHIFIRLAARRLRRWMRRLGQEAAPQGSPVRVPLAPRGALRA